MLILSADDVDRALTFPGLVETLRAAFKAGAIQPVRHHHTVERPGGAASTLLLMPAWTDFAAAGTSDDGYIGVKVVTVSPDNNAVGKPAVMGVYLLLDGVTGEPKALIDGQRLTQWRTASASALAADYLARKDASKLLVIGAGAMGQFLARAHAAVRPIREIRIWNRTSANAEKVVAELSGEGLPGDGGGRPRRRTRLGRHRIVRDDRDSPLVKGALLKPGTHVDLVGASRLRCARATTRRSAAPASMSTRAPARPRKRATSSSRSHPVVLKPEGIIADLHELARGEKTGPRERRRDHAVQVGGRGT